MLQHELRERFPDARVFMDLDSIDPGRPFAEVIWEAVESCAVLVALIGRQWLTLTDEEGQRRLDNPGDYVRFEVHTALERGVPVIPVLADGARPPRQQELPSELHKLAGLNALELSYARYEYDAGRLFDFIQRVLAPIRDREGADRRAQEETDHKAQQAEQRKAWQAEQRKARQAEQRKARGRPTAQPRPRPSFGIEKSRRSRLGKRVTLPVLATSSRHCCPGMSGSWGRTILAPWPPGTAWPCGPGGRGDAVAARDQFAALLPVAERVLGAGHPETLTTRNGLAVYTGQAGDPATARDQLAALLPVRERVLGPGHPQTVATRDTLASWAQQAQSDRGRSNKWAPYVRRGVASPPRG